MAIDVKGLSKLYGTQKAVDNISFSVQQGTILGFLGPNGAGKSTTMKMLTGFIPPSSGTATIYNNDIVSQSIEARRCIGYLPENNPLYLDMYVKEYLEFVGKSYNMSSSKITNRSKELIQQTGLHIEQHKKIGQLSKGYKQRVGLAQAMFHDPKVLILDEPTSGLDPNQLVDIRQLIKELGKSKIILFSTHIMQEVEAVCDRVIIINKGKIVEDNAIANLRQLNKQDILQVSFDTKVDIEKLKSITAVVNVIADPSELSFHISTSDILATKKDLMQFAVTHGIVITALNDNIQTIENVFQRLTKD
jgi:ABC-2 type transport system ATP-binding protein